MDDSSHVREMMEKSEATAWGYTIFRCTYGDDDKWRQFMDVLNYRTRRVLAAEDAEDLMESLDWAVQEDPAGLDGASTADVRNRYRQWLASDESPEGGSQRHDECIMVDKESLDSVINGPQPPERDREKVAFVKIIDLQWNPNDDDDDDDGSSGGGDVHEEEDEEPLEGCRKYDVGWMKLALKFVCPRAYVILAGGYWEVFYKRPPIVATI